MNSWKLADRTCCWTPQPVGSFGEVVYVSDGTEGLVRGPGGDVMQW